MKILILEDESAKYDSIKFEVESAVAIVELSRVDCFQEFHKKVERENFDLIVVDLVAPRFAQAEAIDLTAQIVDAVRDHHCLNFRTPVIALTQHLVAAEENYKHLNSKDITVITFERDGRGWVEPLTEKIISSIPMLRFDFLIFCALPKEADAFSEAGYLVKDAVGILGLEVRMLEIAGKKGAIIVLPRMGLVSCAIAATKAIDSFKPRLVCMSGICAGIEGKANIYDVVIPEICHQHDAGRWGTDGFEPELYSIQLLPDVRLKLTECLSTPDLLREVSVGLKAARSELPEQMEHLEPKVLLAPASSGSAVIARDEAMALVKSQHRKATAFEMESYALYEVARLAVCRPRFFSAKAVVDDGGPSKGDQFHRLACILSAKVVYELIKRGV